METKSPNSVLVTLLIFAMVFSPMVAPSEAARFTHRELLQGGPICPVCVCCAPASPCCRCCASPPPPPPSP